jgi:hypothetical protein
MIKLRLLFIFLLLTNVISVLGQKITLSPTSITDNSYDYVKIIGQDSSGFYLLQSNLSLEIERDRIGLRSRKYQLSYYGFDLKILWTKNIISPSSEISIETVGFYQSKPIVISVESSKDDNSFNFIADTYDSNGNNPIKNKKIGSYTPDKKSNTTKPKILLSSTKKNFGVYVEEARTVDQVVHLIICNDMFTSTSQLKCVLPYAYKDGEISSATLDDRGFLYLLLKVKEESLGNEKKRISTYRLDIFKGPNVPMVEHKVNDSSKQMTYAALTIDNKNNNIVVAGFYSDRGSFAGAGLLYATLSTTDSSGWEISTTPLKSESLIKIIGERNSGGNMGLVGYPIQRVILRSDGGAVIIAEAAYLSEYSFYDYFTQSFNRRIEYHYDNVVIISVNADGQADWSQILKKDQTSLDDEGLYSSIATMLSPDNLTIFYNADIGRNNEVISFKLSSKGELTQKRLTMSGDNITILAKAGKQVDEDVMIVPAISKKKLYLLKISD